jgi:hypothetical protein
VAQTPGWAQCGSVTKGSAYCAAPGRHRYQVVGLSYFFEALYNATSLSTPPWVIQKAWPLLRPQPGIEWTTALFSLAHLSASSGTGIAAKAANPCKLIVTVETIMRLRKSPLPPDDFSLRLHNIQPACEGKRTSRSLALLQQPLHRSHQPPAPVLIRPELRLPLIPRHSPHGQVRMTRLADEPRMLGVGLRRRVIVVELGALRLPAILQRDGRRSTARAPATQRANGDDVLALDRVFYLPPLTTECRKRW